MVIEQNFKNRRAKMLIFRKLSFANIDLIHDLNPNPISMNDVVIVQATRRRCRNLLKLLNVFIQIYTIDLLSFLPRDAATFLRFKLSF